ncbi:hypothetical protein ZWY2020_001432 [Hordeum vulgare]|nr:hypothetical protein ZWY2020_001432 [Hordeum vulgare]
MSVFKAQRVLDEIRWRYYEETFMILNLMPYRASYPILIVGTKKRATDLVASAAIRARCHYVNKKWFSGMLTNWSITKTRLSQFRDLRAEEKMGKFHHLPKRDVAILKRKL